METVYCTGGRYILAKGKKSKKIIFSEEIDSRIDGLSLGFAFIIVGLILLFIPDYFPNNLVGKIIRGIFIALGIFGLFIEFGKLKPISDIKGFDDLSVGIFFLAIWVAFFVHTQHWFGCTVGFICLIIGVYGASRGLIKIIYSIWINQKNKAHKKGEIASDILILLTKLASLALVLFQLIKAIKQ